MGIKQFLILMVLLGSFATAQLNVVVSIAPYHNLVEQITGDAANVTRILPIGASPHTFDPTPRNVLTISQADIVVLNGVLDAWLTGLLEASGSRAPIFEVINHVTFTPVLAGETTPTEVMPDGGFVNPHIWLDPTVMQQFVSAFTEKLLQLDPDNAETYLANSGALIASLEELDSELFEILEPVRGAAFVPFHDAWPYFADRYGLNLVVEIEPFPGREPSPSYLAYALRLVEEGGARAIFTEPQLSIRPAEVVAEQAGVALYQIDPLVGGTGSYQEVMRENARIIVSALQ